MQPSPSSPSIPLPPEAAEVAKLNAFVTERLRIFRAGVEGYLEDWVKAKIAVAEQVAKRGATFDEREAGRMKAVVLEDLLSDWKSELSEAVNALAARGYLAPVEFQGLVSKPTVMGSPSAPVPVPVPVGTITGGGEFSMDNLFKNLLGQMNSAFGAPAQPSATST